MSLTSRVAAVVTGLSLALVGMVGLASPALAAFSPTPIPQEWTPDGPVNEVVVSGDRVYVGGTFTGGVAALDASTGALVWTSSANGDVRALALSSDGKHVIAGGAFTSVSGVTHRKLALLSASNGVADPKWKPAAGGTVRDIVVRGDTAYFGGSFRRHNGIDQGGLGAVSVNPGERAVPVPLSSFRASTNGNVWSLTMTGARLVLGGEFTAVNGGARAQMASFDVSTNTLQGWAPPAACRNCNTFYDHVINGNVLYRVSANAGAVSAVDLSTGRILWNTIANGDAQAVTFADGLLYVGGHFSTIRNQDRVMLAALNPATGAVDSAFTPRLVDSWPGVWAMASTSSRLYVGGHFTHSGPPAKKKRPYFAMFAP